MKEEIKILTVPYLCRVSNHFSCYVFMSMESTRKYYMLNKDDLYWACKVCDSNGENFVIIFNEYLIAYCLPQEVGLWKTNMEIIEPFESNDFMIEQFSFIRFELKT